MVSGVHTSFLHSAYPPLPGHQPPTPGPPPRTPYPCKSVGVPSAQGGCHPHLGALPFLAVSRSLLQERLWLERGYLLPRAPSADTRQAGRTIRWKNHRFRRQHSWVSGRACFLRLQSDPSGAAVGGQGTCDACPWPRGPRGPQGPSGSSDLAVPRVLAPARARQREPGPPSSQYDKVLCVSLPLPLRNRWPTSRISVHYGSET